MVGRRWSLLAVVAALVLVAAACGSSNSTGSGASHTLTVGILTDATGLGASGNKSSVQGIQAGQVLARKDGYTIKYTVGDTQTSPSGALSAAQKLVEQDHVFAVIAVSSITFSAANYLTAQGIPVIGSAADGPEWAHSTNMFSVIGPTDGTNVNTTTGQFLKMEGGTNVGAVGYGITPVSAEATKSFAASADVAGLRVGYLNANFPFGGTDVGPAVLAMKAAGVDSFTGALEPNTAFAMVTGLRQNRVNLKVPLLPTGYGGDLLSSGPGAAQAANGVYFFSALEPVEMHTPATNQFQSDLRTVGVETDPTYAQYMAYASMAVLTQALKAAGPNPSRATLIKTLSGLHTNDAGLLGSHTLNLGQRTGFAQGVDNCAWYTRFDGSKFQLVPGAEPLCGTIVPGRTIPSS